MKECRKKFEENFDVVDVWAGWVAWCIEYWLYDWALRSVLTINLHKCLKGGCKYNWARLFTVVLSVRARGNEHKLEHRRFCLNVKKYSLCRWQSIGTSYPERLWSHELLDISVKVSKSHLGMFLDSVLWVSLFEQRVGSDEHRGPLQPQLGCVSINVSSIKSLQFLSILKFGLLYRHSVYWGEFGLLTYIITFINTYLCSR